MRHVPTLVVRELGAFFRGPMAYLTLLAFQVIAWLNFLDLLRLIREPRVSFSGLSEPMAAYLAGSSSFWIALLVAIPALTMRLIAEERRSGTLEPLLTAPVGEAEVVVAKWLAGVVMYLALLVPFMVYLPPLYRFYPFDRGPLLALAAGLTTMGMLFVAIGVFFSALTRNQIVAAVWTFATLFALMLATFVLAVSGAERREGWAEAARYVAVLDQLGRMAAGQLDLRYPVLHLSATAVLLWGATQAVRANRGR